MSAAELRLEKVERLEDLREDWTRLAPETGHPFATYEWNEAWWRLSPGDRPLEVFAGRDGGGRVVAILPLYLATRRPVRVARFLGYADLMSPICAPGDRPLAARAMREVTCRDDVRLVVAEKLPSADGWGELLGGKLLATHHDPVLRLDGMSWDEFLASRSRNFRDQARRRERKLVREQGLSYRLCDDPERLPADMDALFRLHDARWGEESSGVFDGTGADFHRAFADAALRAGWLRLWLAEVGGETVAAWYGWRFAGSEWVLPGRPRPPPRQLFARLRAARAHRSGGDERRRRCLPLPRRERGVQGALHRGGPGVGVTAPRLGDHGGRCQAGDRYDPPAAGLRAQAPAAPALRLRLRPRPAARRGPSASWPSRARPCARRASAG